MVNLVADIGGTNSRFALCEPGDLRLHEPRKYPNAEFDSLESAMNHYLSDAAAKPTGACIAVAGPIASERISLTNIDWAFHRGELKRQFALEVLEVTNDFTALAMSIPHLSSEDYAVIGGGAAVAQETIGMVGPGTGLGVSALVWTGRHWVPVKSEGGNAGFAPATPLEAELQQLALKEKDFVRTEDFVSGNGLSYLHDLLLEMDDKPRAGVAAKDITWRAKTSDDDACKRTVDVFCGMLGSFAGDMALTFSTLGGMYIGGGMVPQLDDLFARSPFRERFEARGPFSEYVGNIPTYALHSHSRNALIGAAAMLQQEVAHG